ncbi:Epoxyqueuosine reductase [Botrimarina hoheduenensis]|uniref:Epoxyqueuosine reductase n=2 Tax=Botrimarina hoheduenensis TaxID=2528000 RepID=A0A5C5WF98_9BACT|nr:Epoxyqueuosine reductase [Botrimarina hoheduenensis]
MGVAPAVAPPGLGAFDDWLAAGYAGQMDYLAKRRAAYSHPDRLLDGARSLLVLTLDYLTDEPQNGGEAPGRISRYAWGEADYHDLLRPRLHALADRLKELCPGATTRCVVDTAPLMERDFAQLGGLGWIGKNTLLLSRAAGSYFFLAAIVTSAELPTDAPLQVDHCGTCTACLDACPTQAFVGPRVLDATRCISYLTIEAPDLAPRSLRAGIGDWLFGCDVCQEVCPWNRRAQPSKESGFTPREGANPTDLVALFALDEAAFRQRYRQTPLWRAKRRGLLRNAAIVLGNTLPDAGFAALQRGVADHEPLVRAACAWALGRYAAGAAAFAKPARAVLIERAADESDPLVHDEIVVALEFPAA